jgi:hypothetical protein
MAGCDFQAVPGGRAERRDSAARPSTRLLEEQLCTRPANHSGVQNGKQRTATKKKKMPPLAAAESE